MSHILYGDMSSAKKVTNTSFDNLLSKYKARHLPKVADFLSSISRRSKKSAFAYSFGLNHFNKFVESNYNYNIETILEQLGQNKINVYTLLNSFILYLQNDTVNAHDLTPLSVKLYMTSVRSYLSYNDIEITPTRFKHRVKMPTEYHEDEEAINAEDIRKILQKCNNRRLKPYLLVLASSGMRAVEALAIRERDLNFNSSPVEVRVRKEYAKTRTERHVFISDEAAEYLKEWIEWKHRDRHAENKYAKNRVRDADDLVFSVYTTSKSKDPHGLYFKVLIEFQKVLDVAELNGRKEGGVDHRRKITFHSFRRFVKTVIANQHSTDYSEWFLGHKRSSYYVNKPDEYREIYRDKLMKYFTFLSFPTVEATAKGFEAKYLELSKENQELKQRDATNTERIAKMEGHLNELYGLFHLHLDKNKDKDNKVPLHPEQHEALLKKGYINADHPMIDTKPDFKKALIDLRGMSEQEAEHYIKEIEKEKERKKLIL